MPSFTPTAIVMVSLTLSVAAGQAMANDPGDFPFLGSYGVPTSRWGCNSAQNRTEGDYITFGRKELFIHTLSCNFVSWSKVGLNSYDIVQRCLKAKPYRERFQITDRSVTYRGQVYLRCAA